MGWYIGLGTIPIGIFGLRLQRPDRERRALAVPDRHDADRARPAAAAGREGRPSATATIERRSTAATRVDRLRAGAARWSRACRARARRSPPACSPASTASRPRATRSCCRSRPSCCPACSRCARSATRAARTSCRPLIATLLAFIVGYASIALMLRWLTSHSTAVFVVYRVVLGVARDRCSPPPAPSRSNFWSDDHSRARPPGAVGLPPAGREDPRGLLLRRVLQPDEVAAGGRRSPPARADAGLPAQGLDPRRRRRGDRRAQAGRRPLRGRPLGQRLREPRRQARCTRATRSPRGRP